ncbi:hypothetical protein [Microbacterium sp. SA39]|uniref:hypothetical protein n=1 Tax=Microbacterium sp. SA39 TaxID=1263625 RepID=UPI0005F9A99C|nr:hypothetical protein [Microbacterium sp. SA39]KJQ54721.1 hypothetical protein RS85_01455 [Microbacterium sp. SA39]
MNPMFPSGSDALAPPLQDVRGSAKRAINYFHVLVDEPTGSGAPGRHHVQLIGAADADSLREPLSYDAFEIESDTVAEGGTLRVRSMIAELVARFGLYLDPSSWSNEEGDEEQVAAVRRAD